jgi:hypothetical protein
MSSIDDEDVVADIPGEEAPHVSPDPSPKEKPKRFLFETITDLRSAPSTEYLIDGWIPERSVGLLYGRWGSGKTFIGFDWGLHLAFGMTDWHGAKLPGEACDVLIIAREGHTGFVKRVDAFMAHHGLAEDTKHLVFMRRHISFLDDAGFAALKEEIKATNRRFRFVLVDTVGRVLPGADMAKEQPITLFMERLQQLGELTGGTAIGVHHENKSGDANGSMYFQNHSDFMFQMSREGEGPLARGKLTCMKQKEDDDLWSKQVSFLKVELQNGKSSLVVDDVFEDEEKQKEERSSKGRKLSDRQHLALKALNNCASDLGKAPPESFGLPKGLLAVTVEQWRDEVFRTGVIPDDVKNRRSAFQDIRNALKARNLAGERDGLIWPVRAEQ